MLSDKLFRQIKSLVTVATFGVNNWCNLLGLLLLFFLLLLGVISIVIVF